MRIGILALQGAFIEHEQALQRLGVDFVEIRQLADWQPETLDGLIIPGGESTVQGKLLKEFGMFEELKYRIENGLPVMATCAGVILLAQTLVNDDRNYFKTFPIKVVRNAYGRQLGSFHQKGTLKDIGAFDMEFIRAPLIASASPDCTVLGTVKESIAAVRYQNQLAFTFHPELTDDLAVHQKY